ncbi:MAG: hypothetical protein CTY20_13035 [Hyphomicrobium sp.]|nr:MAG: hypothetical protein CTY20_13035 [Hyphomicrobium sp.]
MNDLINAMMMVAAAFVLGEFVMTLSKRQGPLAAALTANAPRFIMAALLGAAIGAVLTMAGIKVAS